MSKTLILVLVGVLVIGGLWYVSMDKEMAKDTDKEEEETAENVVEPVVVNLSAQNNSGMVGTATLTQVGDNVQVKLELTGPSMIVPQPAHIHIGSCASIGAVKYPLNNMVTGKSTTTLNVSLAQLKTEMPLAINVHKSVAESGVYVACGDVKF